MNFSPGWRARPRVTRVSRISATSAGVAVLVGGWFLAHRYGRLRGFVAALTSALSDVIYSAELRHWPMAGRLAVFIFEYAAVLLWVRRLVKWIRGMDEMHRQMTLATLLFSVTSTLLFTLFWLRLEVGGFFEAIIGCRTGFGMGTLSFAILFHSIFYGVGHLLIFNRRYR